MTKFKMKWSLIFLLLWLTNQAAISYAEKPPQIKVDGHFISADIKEAPLKTVLQCIKEQKHFWFQGDEELLQIKISYHFDKIFFTEGFKRILGSFNHAMFYDINGNICGVIILERDMSLSDYKKINDSPNNWLYPPSDGEFLSHPPDCMNDAIEMPSQDNLKQLLFLSSQISPDPEYFKTKGPGAGGPPMHGPGSDKEPLHGPDSDLPLIKKPPVGKIQFIPR